MSSPRHGLGKVHVITGPGKGKTTAAFGLALRAAGQGLRVCIIQFMKSGETTGEVRAAKRVKGMQVRQFGTGRIIGPKGPSAKDIAFAKEAIEYARAKALRKSCDVLVLDEVNMAVSLGLLSAQEVLDFIRSSGGGVEVVLTGRNAPPEFLEVADYVSYIDKMKHPYDKGVRARRGVEW
jgi:cob(I)alamin adenosyltransferase